MNGGGMNGGGMNGGGGINGGFPRLNNPRTPARNLFITGQVFIEDGATVSSPITVVGGCHGATQVLGYTDLKGHFGIDVKPGNSVEDATSPNARGSPVCEVSARLDGYRSNTIDVSQRNGLDNSDIGTILLHRIGDQEGRTVSLTSLQAPGNAKRAFDKGMALARKNRFDEAARQFQKAVALYPRYADAWCRLGHAQVQKNDTEAGRASFAKAVAVDPKLVPPYVELAALNLNQRRWQEAVENTRRAIRLDPFGVPEVYFFDAVANYTLHNWDAAEKSARQLQRLDRQHRYIKVDRMLGAILAARNDYAGAAEQLREYLKFSATDAAEVRAQLADLEKRLQLNPLNQ